MRLRKILHPWLLASYPVLFLWAHNRHETPPTDILPPLAVSLAATGVVFFLLRLLLSDLIKTALVVSAGVVLFFNYGTLHALARLAFGRKSFYSHHPFLAAAWLLLAVIIIAAIIRAKSDLSGLNRFFQAAAVVLVCIPMLQSAKTIADYALRPRRQAAPIQSNAGGGKSRPHIFYIVVDSYARSDVLRDVFGYDNAEFLDYLAGKGFYVAAAAQANYAWTNPSLASSLNYAHLNEIVGRVSEGSTDTVPLINGIGRNAAAAFLHRRGYRFVVFDSGYFPSQIKTADRYMSPGWAPDDFQNELIESTPITALLRFLKKSNYDKLRRRMQYIFSELPRLAKEKEPQFVVAHIMAPHPPFVFGVSGEAIRPPGRFSFAGSPMGVREYRALYRAQINLVNDNLRRMIDAILADSPQPPVIVIQGDHGVGPLLKRRQGPYSPRTRLGILNALLVPGAAPEAFYPALTPVNTFRIIFNAVFDAGLPQAADKSWLSSHEQPYRLTEILP